MLKNSMLSLKRIIGNLIKSEQEKRHSLVGAGDLWKMKQDFQIKFLLDFGLKKTDKLLDIGCGTLRGGIPIIKFLDINNYYGLEVREDVLLEGKKELKMSNLEDKNPTLRSFIHFNEINFKVNFDIIFAFSVLIHMNDEIVESCFKFVAIHLSEKGVFYANVNIGEHKDGNWQGFPVVFRSYEFYDNLASKYNLKIEILGSLIDLGHNSGKEVADLQKMLKISRV